MHILQWLVYVGFSLPDKLKTCMNTVTTSRMWPQSTWNVAGPTWDVLQIEIHLPDFKDSLPKKKKLEK